MNERLSQVGLGTWQFSKGKGSLGSFWPVQTEDNIFEIVKTAIENGVTWFDTAEKYGDGASEQALSKALRSLGVKPSEVLIADKWWPKQRKAHSLGETIDQRLACLNGYPIGLYQIHWPDSQSWLYTEMKYLAKLVEQRKVENVGLCNYNWRQVWRAHKYLALRGVKLASVQVRYNLAFRSIEKNNLLKLAEDLDFKIIAWSPLESGILSGKFHDDETLRSKVTPQRCSMYGFDAGTMERTKELVGVLKEFARRHQASSSQIALAWVAQQHQGRVLTIPGASSPIQAKANAASMKITLSADELAEIDEHSMKACSLH